MEWTPEQLDAISWIDGWRDSGDPFLSLTGPAGTGKSTLVSEIVARYPDATLTAMTGKAALRLSECAGRPATTLHKVLYWPPKAGEDLRFTRLRDPEGDFYVVDESSMMTPVVRAHLEDWAYKGVRFLLVGDSYQLPPVITGDELKQHGEDYSVFTSTRGPELRTVMRSVGGVLRAATKVRETGEICAQSDLDGERGGYEYLRCDEPVRQAVDEYVADRDDHLLITRKNSTRMQANAAIRAKLGHEGPLPDDGEPVLIKKNGQTFMNGEIVTCGGFEDGPVIGSLRCLWMRANGIRILVSVDGGSRDKGGEFFDGGVPWVTDWKKYHMDMRRGMYPEPIPVTWGYCLTAHSAQGSQARRTTVFLERADVRSRYFRKETTLPSGEKVPFSARWIYTATTRSKQYTKMIVG